jgi:uncharacterized membrane protein
MNRWNFVEKIALVAFLIWSAAGLFFTIERITPSTIAHSPVPASLVPFVDFCLSVGDPVLILLAFINTHLHAARQWTAGVARRWGLIVLLFAFGIETLGVSTGFPFGDYRYTSRFGPILWQVPFTIPLAWHVIVTNALFIVRAISPSCSTLFESLFTSLICTLYDVVLEPFATTIKRYWIWTQGTVPPLNYVAWFVLSGFLVWLFAPTLSNRFRRDLRPWLILGITIAIFLAGRFYEN